MECVILFRNTQNGSVGFISYERDDQMAVFKSEDEATKFALSGESPVLRAFPWQVVILDEI